MIPIGCLLLLLFMSDGARSQQRFLLEPQPAVVRPGSNISLQCKIANMGDLSQCRWQKNRFPVGIFSGKYSIPENSRETGDCSLAILSVSLSIDEGEWQCGVTSSNVSLQDSLVSSPVWLAVMVPPSQISVEFDGEERRESVTVRENEVSQVSCVTRLSNPAPTISWRLGARDLPSLQQTSVAEAGVRGKVRTEAVLEHEFRAEDRGARLECVVSHPAYSDGSTQSAAVRLEVLYLGTVSISSVSSPLLQDGKGTLSLSCTAEGSPAPQMMWVRRGEEEEEEEEVVQYGPVLEFSPVLRRHNGSYACTAWNSVGNSSSQPYSLNVLYGPRIVSVSPGPGERRKVRLEERTVLRCEAEGNPRPAVQWLHSTEAGGVQVVGSQASLDILNTDYSHAGHYICRATNTLDGELLSAQSDVVEVEVWGGPRVGEVGGAGGRVGEEVEVEVEVCSSPPPLLTTWQWGAGILLSPGGELDGRYRVDLVELPHRLHCYLTTLTVQRAQHQDSGEYVVRVENQHGMDLVTVHLNISDSLSMLSIISVIITLLIIFLVIVTVITLLYTRQKLCFKDRGEKGKFLENNAEKEKESWSPQKTRKFPTLATKDLSLPPTALGSSQSLNLPGQSSLSPYVMYSLNPGVEAEAVNSHNNLSLPGPFHRARRGSDGSIYNQLQFPSTSNHGSMKRKKRSETSPDTTSSSLSQSPPSAEFRESEYYDNNVKIWSLEYVPRAFTMTKKTVKV